VTTNREERSNDCNIETIGPPAARVGRKSAAPSASPQSRACSRHAGLSSPSGSKWDILLHREPPGLSVGFAGDTNCYEMRFGRSAPARRCTSTPGSCFPTTCTDCDPGRHRGRLLPEGDADFPGRWRAIKKGFSKSLRIGEPRFPVMTRRGDRGIWQRRYWKPTRSATTGIWRRIWTTFIQSGEARFGPASGGVAAFLLSPLCCRRAVPDGVDGWQRRAAGDRVSGDESKRPKPAQAERYHSRPSLLRTAGYADSLRRKALRFSALRLLIVD
jgi:hypothetical protein